MLVPLAAVLALFQLAPPVRASSAPVSKSRKIGHLANYHDLSPTGNRAIHTADFSCTKYAERQMYRYDSERMYSRVFVASYQDCLRMFFPNCQVERAASSGAKRPPFQISRNAKGQLGYFSAYIAYNFWVVIDPSLPPSDLRLKAFIDKRLPSLDEIFKELAFLHKCILRRSPTKSLYDMQPSTMPTDLILKLLFCDVVQQASKVDDDVLFSFILATMLEINFETISFVAYKVSPGKYCTAEPFEYFYAATRFLIKLDDSYARTGFISPMSRFTELDSPGAFIGALGDKVFVAYFVVSREGLSKAIRWLAKASPAERDCLHQFKLTAHPRFFASIEAEIVA